MKTLSLIAFITGQFLIVCSCTEKNLEIKGKVLDENTKAAVPHREIIVQELVNNENKVIPVYNGKFSTDSSGLFAYSLRKVKNVYLYNFCVVGDSTYAYSNIKLGMSELKIYGRFLSFTLKKLTDFSIIINRKSITAVDDVLYLSWESDGINGKFLYPYTIKDHGITSSSTGLKWVGGNIKSEIKTKVFADKKTIVRWEIFSNGKSKKVTDTIFCKRDVSNYIKYKY
jgi:hypothetical protein